MVVSLSLVGAVDIKLSFASTVSVSGFICGVVVVVVVVFVFVLDLSVVVVVAVLGAVVVLLPGCEVGVVILFSGSSGLAHTARVSTLV